MRTRIRVMLLLLPWPGGHAGWAQQLNSSSETSVSVHGVVVNALTHTPVTRALVMSVDQRMAILTDDKGRFEFQLKTVADQTSPAPGASGAAEAYIVAKKPGYFAMGPPFLLPLSDRSALKAELRVQLMPESTVSGLITAPDGGPPSGLTVQLLRKQVQDGAAIWLQTDAQEADVRGRYRFGGLTPGDYKVVTAEWVDRIGPYPLPVGKPMLGYPPEAFPNGSTPATAEVIHLGGGQNIAADISLRSASYHPVEIPVVSNARVESLSVEVKSENGPGYSLGFNVRTQRVEGALPDGVYHLTVIENSGMPQPGSARGILFGSEELTVAGKPAHGSPIKLLPGVSVPVTVREEYTRPDPNQQAAAAIVTPSPVAVADGAQNATPPQYDRVEGINVPQRAVEVLLVLGDRNPNGFAFGLRDSQQDGPGNDSLVVENVPPGVFKVQMSTRRGYIASATANGVDLLRGPLVIAAGAASPSISIVLRDDTATITGTVSLGPGKEVVAQSRHPVWAFPLEDHEASRPVVGMAQPDGKFSISDVVPGRYLVLVSKEDSLNLEYRNPEVMKAYESKGAIVSVSSGQTVDVQLKEAVMDDNWPETEVTVD